MSEGGRDDHNARQPSSIDEHVGRRVRLRRVLLGMSQQSLGDLLGVTFQQVQKYEKGANRIGASRLFSIAQVLNVPIQFFYDEFTPDETAGARAPGLADRPQENFVVEFLASREGLELNKAFVRISNPAVRRSVLDLVRALAGEADRVDKSP